MNRTDKLTDRLIDGSLTDAEAVELEALLAADPEAQARHVAAVRLELVLRGLRTEFDFAGPTVAKLEADRVERTTAAVMAEIANRYRPGRRVHRVRVWVAFAAMTAALIVTGWLGLRSPDAPRVPAEPSPSVPDFARLTAISGSVEVVGPSGAFPARPDQPLAPERTLRTVGEESVAVVEFPDHTRVEVHPDSVVQLGPEPVGAPARRLYLIQGRITAFATGRLVVGAGATEVEATRGSFSLWSAGSGSARVEPLDGDVRVSRGAPAEAVVLGPGRAAYVRDEQTPMGIDTPWQIDVEPRGRLDFAALDVGFDADGDIVAVSAKQWTCWKPGTPDPGRTLFPPKIFNDGLAAWLTPDRRAVALCRTDDREERIVIRELPSGAERGQVPARVSEPRFLCVAPDASWVATVASKPNNRRVRVWDVASGRERFALDLGNSVTCLAAAPDGRGIAVGVSDLGQDAGNAVVMFDASTGTRLFELPTRRKAITTLTITPDGRFLAVGFNGAIQIWDLTDLTLVTTIDGFERVVTRLAFDPPGHRLAAGTGDGQVWIWSVATGHRIQILDTGTRGVRSLAFSPNGKFLVTATNKAPVAVWEVAAAPTPDL